VCDCSQSCLPIVLVRSLGLIRDVRRRFKVSCACGINRGQSMRGNSGSHPDRMAMKWFFHVRMARSAAFRRWEWAGVS